MRAGSWAESSRSPGSSRCCSSTHSALTSMPSAGPIRAGSGCWQTRCFAIRSPRPAAQRPPWRASRRPQAGPVSGSGAVRAARGARPSAFLRQTRVRHAAELLRAGETDLDRIATASGYASRQGLCRAFRREPGSRPRSTGGPSTGGPSPGPLGEGLQHHRDSPPAPRTEARAGNAQGLAPGVPLVPRAADEPETRPAPCRAPRQAAAAVTSSFCIDSADSLRISGSSPNDTSAPTTATPPSQK